MLPSDSIQPSAFAVGMPRTVAEIRLIEADEAGERGCGLGDEYDSIRRQSYGLYSYGLYSYGPI